MKLFLITFTFLFICSTSVRADRKEAEKFFAPEVQAIPSTAQPIKRKAPLASVSSGKLTGDQKDSKNGLIGFSMGVSHIGNQALSSEAVSDGKSGWGATLSFLNRRAPRFFDSIYQLIYQATTGPASADVDSLGGMIQWLSLIHI